MESSSLQRSPGLVARFGERNTLGTVRIDCVEREIHFSEKQVKEVLDGRSYLALRQPLGLAFCCLVIATYATNSPFFERRVWC